MEYRQLGSSDLRVSEVALGSWLTLAGGIERTQAEAPPALLLITGRKVHQAKTIENVG